MMRRKRLIATAIIASVVVTACSDMTAPNKVVPGVLPAATRLASQSGPAISAEVSKTCPAPGTGYPGALNMARDATMNDIPVVKDAAQGNLGMFLAITSSGC
jgi:hypothetical protein